MIEENGYYLVRASDKENAWCDSGIFDGDTCLDTCKREHAERPLHDPYLTLVRYKPLEDYLFALPYYCLSERAHELFTHRLNIWPAITWVKVRVLGRHKQHLANYWWPKCYALASLDVLDMQHATYTTYPPNHIVRPNTVVVKDVQHWVVDMRVIGELDWFYGSESSWFGSPRAESLVREQHLTGFKFTPITVWR